MSHCNLATPQNLDGEPKETGHSFPVLPNSVRNRVTSHKATSMALKCLSQGFGNGWTIGELVLSKDYMILVTL